MEGILIGQYIPGNSIFHRLDPRTKILASVILVWVIFLLRTPREFGVFGLIVAGFYFASGVYRNFWRVMKPGFYLVILTVVINMLFTPGEKLASLGFVVITREGLIQGITMGVRLAYLIAVSSLLTLTTSPIRMTDGLELLMNPLKRVKFPASELAMMMNIALRFIPTFWEETEKIIKAQTARGADFKSRNFGKRAKYMTALLVPLFVSAFKKADELSTAMESRGYFVGMPRTSLHRLRMRVTDYGALAAVYVLSISFILTKFGLISFF